MKESEWLGEHQAARICIMLHVSADNFVSIAFNLQSVTGITHGFDRY